jgi:phosphoribosylformylglycinamidine cyclo-ligase
MITYKKAGVDIDAGNELVRRIKKMAPRIGGFSDGIVLPKGYKEPVLIGCTDGVGTKLAIAQALERHDTIGYDLVGMNVNDLICSGARPLFFLDYFACGALDVSVAEAVVRGIVNACKESDCELIGGETAEMPGFYKPGEYDLAGFATGVVEKKKMLRPKDTVRAGDVMIGLPSSGLHSNGYSLVRRVIPRSEWKALSSMLLAPTRLYVRPVLAAINALNRGGKTPVKGLVHVTGGGFTDNIPRILPKTLSARLNVGSWKTPEIFGIIQQRARLSRPEMFRTFNNGLGLILVVSPGAANAALKKLKGSTVVGDIIKGDGEVVYA